MDIAPVPDRGVENKFDPFSDLKKSGNPYDAEPILKPLYAPNFHISGQAGDDANLNDYYGLGQTRMEAELRDRVQGITQRKTVSLGAMSCGLGLSFANCEVPKTPCNFTFGVFDLNSRSTVAAAAKEDYAFSFLSNHCSF